MSPIHIKWEDIVLLMSTFRPGALLSMFSQTSHCAVECKDLGLIDIENCGPGPRT